MDWSRTKLIFIVTFLVLNLFLGYQLYQKQSENKFEYISESFLEIEDQLSSMNISYPELPEAPKKLTHIIGQTYAFTEDELLELKSEGIAYRTVNEEQKLIADFSKVMSFSYSYNESDPSSFLEAFTLFHDDYTLANYLSTEDEELVFIQTYKGRPIYQKEENTRGQITVTLNEAGNITGFEQTYLDTNEQGDEQELLSALKAMNQLISNEKLFNNERVTFMELGYYSLVEGKLQVLAPTWLIEVNGDRHYYVNAVNGLIDDPNSKGNPELKVQPE